MAALAIAAASGAYGMLQQPALAGELPLKLDQECTNCRFGPHAAASPPLPARTADGARLPLRPGTECSGCAASDSGPMKPSVTEAIVTIRVNMEPKGEHDVLVAQDGDVLIRQQDLDALGLGSFTGRTIPISGVPYISLRGLDQVKYELIEARLELNITVNASRLGRRQMIDFRQSGSTRPLRPDPGAGLFLNYNLTGSGRAGSDARFYGASWELGAPLGEYLFLTDGINQPRDGAGGPPSSTVRLSSSLTKDNLDTLQRTVIGDFVTQPSSVLASSLRLGGLSFSRRYALDPYYVRSPGQIISATAALPSEVLVYTNGVLVRRQQVQPGAFELQNLANAGGLQVTEVVIRDVLGNEQRIVNPFFVSNQVLRSGTDEYSFDAGLERRGFGLKSADYGSPGFSAFYRRGITDALTLGLRGEELDRRFNLGPEATFVAGIYGVFNTAFAYGRGDLGSGWGYSLGHSYAAPRFATSIVLRGQGRDYGQAGTPGSATVRSDLSGTVSWAVAAGSQLRFTFSNTDSWESSPARGQALSLLQRIGVSASFAASFLHSSGAQNSNEVLFTLAYTFGAVATNPSVSAQSGKSQGMRTDVLQVSGGSFDSNVYYRVTEQRKSGPGTTELLNPFLQYNFSRATVRTEYVQQANAAGTYNASVQGAVVKIGDTWGLTRSVYDSFGVAKVGDVPGVKVYANNIEIGRTGPDGSLFVPRLSSYFANSVSIDPNDLPIDYIVSDATKTAVPPYRGGVIVDFQAHPLHAVSGRLVVRKGETSVPFGDAEGSVQFGDRKVSLYTSRDGSFYMEDAQPGEFSGSARHGDETCRFVLALPALQEAITDIGDVQCRDGT